MIRNTSSKIHITLSVKLVNFSCGWKKKIMLLFIMCLFSNFNHLIFELEYKHSVVLRSMINILILGPLYTFKKFFEILKELLLYQYLLY